MLGWAGPQKQGSKLQHQGRDLFFFLATYKRKAKNLFSKRFYLGKSRSPPDLAAPSSLHYLFFPPLKSKKVIHSLSTFKIVSTTPSCLQDLPPLSKSCNTFFIISLDFRTLFSLFYIVSSSLFTSLIPLSLVATDLAMVSLKIPVQVHLLPPL